eukprot:514306-Pyramimonas_sp.AAC.1
MLRSEEGGVLRPGPRGRDAGGGPRPPGSLGISASVGLIEPARVSTVADARSLAEPPVFSFRYPLGGRLLSSKVRQYEYIV